MTAGARTRAQYPELVAVVMQTAASGFLFLALASKSASAQKNGL